MQVVHRYLKFYDSFSFYFILGKNTEIQRNLGMTEIHITS